jgi:hypothetical protein
LIELVKTSAMKAQFEREVFRMQLNFLSSKLEIAKSLQTQIKDLREEPSFMTEDQIIEEEKVTQQKLEAPSKILSNIEDLENNSGFLDFQQIQALKNQIQIIKSSLGKSEDTESPSDLDCIICLSIPKPGNGNDESAKNVIVYSCDQDHLLCQDCILRVDDCPSKNCWCCLM